VKQTQYEAIGRLIKRKSGATPLELMEASHSTSVHKRLSELRERGWTITRREIPGKSFGRYFGVAPR
jgi:hypothetical protein